MLNQKLIAQTSAVLAIFLVSVGAISAVNAQDVTDVRWKSADQVRAMYGEPQSIRGPIGTHASYTMWSYDGFVVAFANEKAFHLFNTGAADTMELNEERPESQTN